MGYAGRRRTSDACLRDGLKQFSKKEIVDLTAAVAINT
jgi:hypothetical protein